MQYTRGERSWAFTGVAAVSMRDIAENETTTIILTRSVPVKRSSRMQLTKLRFEDIDNREKYHQRIYKIHSKSSDH